MSCSMPVLLSLSPRVCSDSCLLSWWCYLTISSFANPSSFGLPSFPAAESFLVSWLFASGSQSIGASASASVLPVNIQGWSPLGWTGLISLQAKGLSRVFSSATIWKSLQHSAFFMVRLSHPFMTTGKTTALTRWTFVGHIEMSPHFTPLSSFYEDLAIIPRLETQWVQGLRWFLNKLL